jgi:hypothetical protein
MIAIRFRRKVKFFCARTVARSQVSKGVLLLLSRAEETVLIMPAIANPMDALKTLQPAIDAGKVSLQQCTLHKDLWVLVDFPGGELRTTYAVLEDEHVQCIVQLLQAEPIKGIPCLSIGYATMEGARKRGLASSTVPKAIEEMRVGLRKHGIRRFYVEAVVSTENKASQKVALHALGPSAKTGTDHFSGEAILQFVKLIK